MSNNDNICVNDFGKICRTCLAKGEMKLLYEDCYEEVCLIEMLMSVTFIQFSEKDGLQLPVQICLNCESELKRAYKFSKKCLEVDKKLRKCYKEFENKGNKSKFASSQNEDVNSKTSTNEITPEQENEFQVQIEIEPEIIFIKQEISEKKNIYKTGDNLLQNNENLVPYESDNNIDSDFLPENENNFNDPNIDDKINEEISKSEKKPTNNAKQKISKIKGPPFECKKCSEKFATYKLLWQHWKEVKHPNVENCKICLKSFASCNMPAHMRTHSGEKPFCCEICGMGFARNCQLIGHLITHTGDTPHKCNVCNKGFSLSASLKEHMLIHTGVKPYACNYCGRNFRVKRNLVQHMKTHTGEKPYKCNYCNKDFAQPASLRIHMRIHTGERPFICDSCGKGFVSNGLLKQHLKSHNPDTKTSDSSFVQPQHECKTCNKKFNTKLLLRSHSVVHGEKTFLCNYCGQGFLRKAGLNEHIRVHTGEKPFSCQKCGKNFSQSGSLKDHIRTHTDEKTHICEICNRGFTHSKYLSRHLARHTDEKPFSCEFCNKNFSSKTNLKFHTRIHTGETPYLCSICNKGFRDSSSMKKHKAKHEKETTK